jgi:hypothetical protein
MTRAPRFLLCPFPWSVAPILRVAVAALAMFALLVPANAQFWGDSWGGRQQPQQRQQPYNPFGGYWGDRPGGFWGDRQREAPRYPRQRERAREPEREQPPDYSRAPPATPRKDATVKIVVMGDANADWLAYGLEDAYSEKPEIGIVRKHRTDSGLQPWSAFARFSSARDWSPPPPSAAGPRMPQGGRGKQKPLRQNYRKVLRRRPRPS